MKRIEQGINPGFLRCRRDGAPDRTLEEQVTFCRNAGFRNLDYLTGVLTDSWEDQAKKDRELMDRLGVKVHQSHSPMFRYACKGHGEDFVRKYTPRAVRAASILGAEYLVIHADEVLLGFEKSDSEVLKETIELLKPIMDLCVKYHVRPAIENLFEDGSYAREPGIRSRLTAKTEEVLAVMEAFPGTGIGCCWDNGHAMVSYGEEKYLAELDRLLPYITCTHMHDNNYHHDSHQTAFIGNSDWKSVMQRFRSAGWDKVFCWEFVYERFPDEVVPSYLDFVFRSGAYLLGEL